MFLKDAYKGLSECLRLNCSINLYKRCFLNCNIRFCFLIKLRIFGKFIATNLGIFEPAKVFFR